MFEKTINSIKWRILAIFVLIVFIVMTIAGVFVTNKLESYEIDSIRSSVFKTLDIVMLSMPFGSYTVLTDSRKLFKRSSMNGRPAPIMSCTSSTRILKSSLRITRR